MKAMPTSNLRYAWSVKVVNHYIRLAHTCKVPLASLATRKSV